MSSEARAVDAAVLRSLALPEFGTDTSKDDRGTVLVIGGTRETPGGVMLAGVAALRAGAGRIFIATVESIAPALAVNVPEACVIGLPETCDGAIAPEASAMLRGRVDDCDVVLVGVGMMDAGTTGELLCELVPHLTDATRLVLDAAAVRALPQRPGLLERFGGTTLAIPNPREMAALLDRDEDDVRERPGAALTDAVRMLDAAVALRGRDTWMSLPGEAVYVDDAGMPALATAGSGDVLAGVLAGLLARGAQPISAMVWAARLHAQAARVAAVGPSGVGLIARDLLDALPEAFRSLESV